MAEVGLIDDKRFELHEQEPGHPEAPERVRTIRRALREAELWERMVPIPVREASHKELLLVHTPEYVTFVEKTCLDRAPAVLGPDVSVVAGSWIAGRLAAGAAIEAVRWVLGGDRRRAFCNLRPPGHHALPNQAMGFCIFNNVAIAARWALKKGGLSRVAIVDWDVHHGNGTQDIFWQERRVFYASLHQYPFYPGSGAASQRGEGEGEGTTLNLPLAAKSGDVEYLRAFDAKLLPALEAFQPELILISCGFDAHWQDPLAQMQLTEKGYAEMTRRLTDLAHGRIVSMLEGGYALPALGASAVAHVRMLFE